MKTRTHKLVVLAMIGALAYILMYFLRIPVMPVPPYLKYDPKDVVIVIAGFLYGPLSVVAVSALVSVIEMFTVSETGYIGFLMNVLATCSFACPAAAIYKWKRTLSSAVYGLAIGALLATGVMLLWNYVMTPIYLGVPRAAVAASLIPVFLPYNLLKTGLNASFAVLLYKPVRLALTQARLIPVPSISPIGETERKVRFHPGLLAVSVVVIVTCVLLILAWNGRI
ncbi:MAG: ECF transporter S component [Oscillospiraceae bacterium]|nr:ECF transporter S component [Oscillospiraceae bacterium]